MKKIYLFLFISIFTFSLSAQVEVTFQVDMTNESVSSNGVHVAGAFQGWDPAATALSDDDGDGVWSVTLTVDFPGEYLYKYVNGNAWASDGGANEGFGSESGLADCGEDDGFDGHNRSVTIPNEATYVDPAYIYNSCEISSIISSTEDLEDFGAIKVSPNPFTDYTTITFGNPNNELHDLMISDITGRLVANYSNIRGTQVEVNRGELLNGIYFATLQDKNGNAVTKKLMVR